MVHGAVELKFAGRIPGMILLVMVLIPDSAKSEGKTYQGSKTLLPGYNQPQNLIGKVEKPMRWSSSGNAVSLESSPQHRPEFIAQQIEPVYWTNYQFSFAKSPLGLVFPKPGRV